jgi:hypothetical protein
VYNEYFRELHATCKLIELTNLKAEDELSLQLWELMNIFGKHLYNGAENCFANNDISFNDKVVKIPERSREEIKELLANWKGTLVVGDDISPSPWISVEERLPELEKEVMVSAKDKYIDIDQLADNGEGGCYWWKNERVIFCEEDKITHWMPIPELPKEVLL